MTVMQSVTAVQTCAPSLYMYKHKKKAANTESNNVLFKSLHILQFLHKFFTVIFLPQNLTIMVK